MNYRHKNLNTQLEKVLQHVTNNIQNQEKLSLNMKRLRRIRPLTRVSRVLWDANKKLTDEETEQAEE